MFVGRERQLAEARRALGGIGGATGAALLVSGEAGAGKTTLIDRVLAEVDGFRIVRDGGSELEAELPFAPLIRALGLRRDTEDEHAARLGELLRGGGPADPTMQRLELLDGMADLVERWCYDQPVLLVLDDLHWADDATLTILDRLARRLSILPVGVVATVRPYPTSDALATLSSTLRRSGRATFVDLEALPAGELIELATGLLGAAPGPRLQTALAATGGNPLFATELVAAVRGELTPVGDGTVDLEGPVGLDRVGPAILRNIASLPDDTDDTLTVASVLGTRFDVDDLAVVCDHDVLDVVERLAPARRAGVVVDADGRVGFRHDLVRDAVYHGLPAAARQAWHRTALLRLRAAGRPGTVWIAHLREVDLTGLDGATDIVADAADRLLGVDPAAARDLLHATADRIGTLPPALRVDLATALHELGDYAACAAELDRLLTHPAQLTDSQRDQLLRLIGWMDVEACMDTPNVEAAERLEAAGLGESGAAFARMLRDIVPIQDEHGNSHPAVTDIWRRLLAEATDAHDPYGVFVATRQLALPMYGIQNSPTRDDLAWQSVQAASETGLLSAQWRAAHAYAMVSSDPDRAREVLQRALPVAEMLSRNAYWSVLGLLLELELRTDHWPEQRANLEEFATAIVDGTTELPFFVLPTLADCGDLDLAGRILETRTQLGRPFVPGTEDMVSQELTEARLWGFEVARMRTLGTAPDDGATEDLLVSLAERYDALINPGYPGLVRDAVSLAVVTAMEHGRADLARRLADRTAAWDPDSPWARWQAACADDDPDAMTHDPDELSRAWVSPYLAEARAAALARTGRTDDAIEAYEMVLARWENRQAPTAITRIRAKLRDLGVNFGPTRMTRATYGWEAITPAEWRVAALIPHNLVYREIAERLHLSRRTVEAHAASVLRKLNVSSRRDLADLLTTDDGQHHLRNATN